MQGHERVAALQNERVHHVAHRCAARVLERIPQVAGDRVGIGVGLEVGTHAIAEHLRADVLLEHAQDPTALFVGQHVEHALRLLGRPDRVLNRTGQVERVDGQGGLTRRGEADPTVPRGPEGVDTEHFHECREGLVEPDALPPAHGHQVAEPHVRQLVRDDVGDTLELGAGGLVLVDEQRRVAERDASQVLHRAGGEVRNGHQVDLVPGVGDVEVLREEAQCERADLQGETGQWELPRRADNPEGYAVHIDGLGHFEPADDEGHQVRRHLHGGREPDALFVADLVDLDDGGVGDRVEVGLHDQRDLEDGLAIRLVEAGEGAPGVHRLELGRGHCVGLAVRTCVGGTVEASQLVVERAAEPAADGAGTGRNQVGRLKGDLLELVVEAHAAQDGDTIGGQHLDVADRQLGRVEHDLVGRRVDDGVDPNGAGERGGGDVRLEFDGVGIGLDRSRQTERLRAGRDG